MMSSKLSPSIDSAFHLDYQKNSKFATKIKKVLQN